MNQFKLYRIRILVLIHHDVSKALLIVIEYLRTAFEQLHRFHNDIIKIQCITLLQGVLIFSVNLCRHTFAIIAYRLYLEFPYIHQFILGRRYFRQQRPLLIHLRVDVQTFADLFDHGLLIVCIIDGKICIVSQSINITS